MKSLTPLCKQALPPTERAAGEATNFRRGLAASATGRVVPDGLSLVDELKELVELKAQGILSDEEFTSTKAAAIAKHGS